jgi:hypothetical protein
MKTNRSTTSDQKLFWIAIALGGGEKFNLRAFHDFVWKNGNVPLSLQRWEYLGPCHSAGGN